MHAFALLFSIQESCLQTLSFGPPPCPLLLQPPCPALPLLANTMQLRSGPPRQLPPPAPPPPAVATRPLTKILTNLQWSALNLSSTAAASFTICITLDLQAIHDSKISFSCCMSPEEEEGGLPTHQASMWRYSLSILVGCLTNLCLTVRLNLLSL